jgi:hypothetical protein
MSLIEEALRRLKDPSIPSQQTTTPAPRKTKPDETTPAHPWSTTPPLTATPAPAASHTTNVLFAVALTVLVLTAVLIVGGAFWLGRTLGEGQRAFGSRASTPATTATPVAASGLSKPNTAHTGSGPSHTEEGLILSGVVEGLGEPYAVINGMIVSVGERIGDLTLLEIGDSLVKLRRTDGSETVLHVAR